MAMKCCTKLETAKERCPIVFQGHPSNFKVTRYKTSPILTQIGRFRIIGRSQLSNPSDLPCFRSCIKFQAHTGWKIDDLDKIWARLLGRSQLSNPSDLPCSRSSAKFQGQTAEKIVEFDPDWAFPDFLSVTPFWLCSHHRIIMKFSGVIITDQGNVHAKGQGQRSRSRSQRSQPNLAVSGL